MGVIFVCCSQNHLQLGVLHPQEPMLGFYSPRGQCWGFYSPREQRWGSCLPRNYEHIRLPRQEPSTRRKGRPRRHKSSQTCTVQLESSASLVPDLREQLNKKRSTD